MIIQKTHSAGRLVRGYGSTKVIEILHMSLYLSIYFKSLEVEIGKQ